MTKNKEQYINKSAVVAEIERRITAYQKNFDKADNKIARLSTDGRMQSLKELLSFIDTLEVKEINSTDAFIRKARKYFYKELPNFRSFMESGTSFIKNFESFIRGE